MIGAKQDQRTQAERNCLNNIVAYRYAKWSHRRSNGSGGGGGGSSGCGGGSGGGSGQRVLQNRLRRSAQQNVNEAKLAKTKCATKKSDLLSRGGTGGGLQLAPSLCKNGTEHTREHI